MLNQVKKLGEKDAKIWIIKTEGFAREVKKHFFDRAIKVHEEVYLGGFQGSDGEEVDFYFPVGKEDGPAW